ncbi:hypothetical protein DICVIV_00867 [Dictyocaulus viviparus]|uniref:Uncharacterized protein n=1 Tax=Dictyocaulus viviparus TaxID=29172 RepID=A0A0D8Y815_DICVI|nr:hypothetical protein DICVIV_00867 [Dictyocaulus viviparus]
MYQCHKPSQYSHLNGEKVMNGKNEREVTTKEQQQQQVEKNHEKLQKSSSGLHEVHPSISAVERHLHYIYHYEKSFDSNEGKKQEKHQRWHSYEPHLSTRRVDLSDRQVIKLAGYF